MEDIFSGVRFVQGMYFTLKLIVFMAVFQTAV